MGPILTGAFHNRNTAFVFAVFASMLITFLFDSKMAMFTFSFLGGSVAAFYVPYFKQRSFFLKSGLLAGALNCIVIVLLNLFAGGVFSGSLLFKVAMGLAGGIVSGILVAGLAPLFEPVFGYTTV